MLDNLAEVRRFVAVAETGGFTAAARQLGLSVNQVSRAVQRLEERVGGRLLHRTTRSVSLTARGDRLLGPARRVLAAVAEAEQAVTPSTDRLRGKLRVALPSVVVTPEFLSHLAAWLARHDGISLELIVADAPLDVVAEALDVQLRFSMPTQATLLFRRVTTFASALAAHRDYAAANGLPEHPSQLVDHACLRFLDGTPEEQWTLVHVDGEQQTVSVGGNLACDTSLVLTQAMQAGLGIGARPLGAAPSPDLVEVLPGWQLEPMPLWAVQPPAHRRQPAVASLLEVTRHIFDGWLPPE